VLVLSTATAAVLGGGISGAVARAHEGTTPARPTHVSLGALPSSTTIVERPAASVAGVAARILPSVVSIEVRTKTGGDTGSGIVISPAGYILTNNHVIAAAADGSGKLSVVFADEKRVSATIVGRDTVSDLAVVRVSNVHGLRAATLGSSDELRVGDSVVAVGSPLGLAGTVTSGIVSALDRPVEADDAQGTSQDVIDAIQTDAAINPGNSGGPLVDLAGRVVGVNSAIATLSGGSAFAGSQGGSIGLGFAIPIDEAKRIARQLITLGYSTHAIIGVQLDGSYTGNGARVGTRSQAVTAGGPAARGGIHGGDVIIAIDGHRVTDADELIVEIRRRLPGEQVTLTYLRDGARHTTDVVLGSRRSD
jgi:putative serine protease PepD